MDIGLGTVQFGLDYGISNKTGRTPFADVLEILREARENDVRLLDTAAAYGASEDVLGRALAEVGGEFRLITKTKPQSAPRITSAEVDDVGRAFERSLGFLKRDFVDGLLVHHAGDLLKPGGDLLWDRLQTWRKEGRVRKIGVSVYDPEETRRLAAFAPEIVQLPMNFLDQRFLATGELRRLKSEGAEIHVRSLFLQGLLLMDPSTLPSHFASIRGLLTTMRAEIIREEMDVKQACFAWAEKQSDVDAVVLGVTSLSEWRELLTSARPRASRARRWSLPSETWGQTDETLINPSLWPRREASNG